MGMSTYILDRQEEFYDIADKYIGNFNHIYAFQNFMYNHIELLQGTDEYEHLEEIVQDLWKEKWSKYQ